MRTAHTPARPLQVLHAESRDELFELVYGANKGKMGVQGVWSEDADLFMAANPDAMRRVGPPPLLAA